MSARLSGYTRHLVTLGEQVFNWLEDARIARMEHVTEPANYDYPAEVHRLSTDSKRPITP